MSHEPSAKRQRVDDGSSPDQPAPATSVERVIDLRAKFLALPSETVDGILTSIAYAEPYGLTARLIDEAYARTQEQERSRAARAISFAKYAGKADYLFNERYERLSGSKQYNAAGDVQSAVEAMLGDIVKRTKSLSVYATKKSAVETMRSIFEVMLDSGGVIGNEVRNDCNDWDTKFLQIMGTFTEDELQRLATEDGGAWVEQFRALVQNANEHCVLKALQESLDDLESYQAGAKDEEEEDEDEDEDEQGGE